MILLIVTFLMGIVAVLGGVGGGVLFVPIISGFFPFHIDFVRGTGLLVALCGALAAGPELLKSNLASLRLAMPMALIASTMAIVGAMVGLSLPSQLIELSLGFTILFIVIIMLFAKKADLPNIQRRIMYASAKWGRRSIVATHLLESMINNPTPTRAEVTDVANAIYEGSDAVMLSGETSIGKYPIQCIKMIKKIASKTEYFRTLGYEKFLQDNSDWQNIAKGARDLASRVNADAIVIITRSGQTASVVSNTKPFRMPIYAFTNNQDTYSHLSIIGGIQPYFIKSIANKSKTISNIKSILIFRFIL